jgi:hypothetical protein
LDGERRKSLSLVAICACCESHRSSASRTRATVDPGWNGCHFALIASLKIRPTLLLGISILSSAASVGAISAGLKLVLSS